MPFSATPLSKQRSASTYVLTVFAAALCFAGCSADVERSPAIDGSTAEPTADSRPNEAQDSDEASQATNAAAMTVAPGFAARPSLEKASVGGGGLDGARAAQIRRVQLEAGPEFDVLAAGPDGTLSASNDDHAFGARFHAESVELRGTRDSDTGPAWRATARLAELGRRGHMRPAPDVLRRRHDGNQLEFERASGVTEWYVNGPLGLEQGFTLARSISEPRKQPLVLEMEVDGLTPRMVGNSIVLRGEDGRDTLHYGALYTEDARGRTVPSRLAVREERIVVIVEDSTATYPIEIDPVFGTEQSFFESGDAEGVAAADIDADGDQDIVAAFPETDEVVWYENLDGAGRFGRPNVIADTHVGVQLVAVADVNGDGDLDVVAGSRSSDEIIWYSNSDGNGTFSGSATVSSTANGVWDLRVGDIDGDNDIDIVAANAADDEVVWYPNTGFGSYGSANVVAQSVDSPYGVAVADIDGDNDLDVLSASFIDDKVAWYENTDGAGSFGSQQVISTAGWAPNAVHAADFDGDGDLDVVATARNDDEVAWFENTDGSGSFGSRNVFTTSADWVSDVDAADVDGDGDLDVVSSSELDDTIAWYENTDGNGSFGALQTISSSANSAEDVEVADIDGDGAVDLLSASDFDNKIAWYRNDGTTTFWDQQVLSPTTLRPQAVHAADLDGDGDNDVLSVSENDNKVAWYENTDGAGTFETQFVVDALVDDPTSISAADIDGDGDLDILVSSDGDDTVGWYENTTGNGTFGTRQAITTTAFGVKSARAGDIDGDGDLDVLAGIGSFSTDVAWFENLDGNGTFGPPQTITAQASTPRELQLADIDGDGDLDAVSASSGNDTVAWYENTDGAGTFGSQSVLSSSINGAWSLQTADIDGDGDLDVAVSAYFDDEIGWFENTDGDGTFGSFDTISTATNGPLSIYVVDMDGDLDQDVLSASTFDDKIAWYENTDGAGTFGNQQVITSAFNAPSAVFAADLDGDADRDVIAAMESDDVVYWFENLCTDSDGDGACDSADDCDSDPNKIQPGFCGCGQPENVADDDADGTPNCADDCPNDANKTAPGVCGCGTSDADADGDGTLDCNDGCVNDANKTAPGVCGCGTSDADSDGDGTLDCNDGCVNDANKTAPGVCGCGTSDADSDGDGTADCNDGCVNDANKTAPGVCGCGTSDADSDGDGTADCNDGCVNDANKTAPGVCGCGVSDADSDGDGTADCNDGCVNDANKTAPGVCGCGTSDVDSDSDGTLDCNDGCVNDANKTAPGVCGCGTSDADSDSDGTLDCNDGCVNDANKTAPGVCGCGTSDVDSDSDGTLDCNDGCVNDANKTAPGVCGCGTSDADSDSDGTLDCNDGCVNDANKTAPGVCGCGTSDVDSDSDGLADCEEEALGTDPNVADSDGDGLDDGTEQQSGTDPTVVDTDGDGLGDGLEDELGTDGTLVDTDGDGTDDGDEDTDGDGVTNIDEVSSGTDPAVADTDGDGEDDGADNCPLVVNADQTDTDGDGVGDACSADEDGDGFADTIDNCPSVENTAQVDTDGDEQGDACDADDDDDGVDDVDDDCPLTVGVASNNGCPPSSDDVGGDAGDVGSDADSDTGVDAGPDAGSDVAADASGEASASESGGCGCSNSASDRVPGGALYALVVLLVALRGRWTRWLSRG
jgi:hypothetical protein